MKLTISSLAAAGLMLVFSGQSQAGWLSGCASCNGASYLLEYNATPIGTFGATGKIYDVFLTIDTTNLNLPNAVDIYSAAIKLASSDSLAQSSIAAAPDGVGGWTLKAGGIGASGCDGHGGGFICALDSGSASAPVPISGSNKLYTWEFHYATTSGILTGTGDDGPSIKMMFIDKNGKKTGSLVSTGIGLSPRIPVPEPSIAVFGTLLSGTALLIRKRRKA